MEPIIKKLNYIEDKLDILAAVIAIMTFAVMSVGLFTELCNWIKFSPDL